MIKMKCGIIQESIAEMGFWLVMKKYTFTIDYDLPFSEKIDIISEQSENDARNMLLRKLGKKRDNVKSIEMVKVILICPYCQKNPLGELPGISRKDKKTQICQACEVQEAVNEYYQ